MYTIHRYLKKAKCEYSNRDGEAVEISSTDGSIDRAILSFAELQKLLRFRQSQADKKNASVQKAGSNSSETKKS